ncbi:hypothetical protein Hanom_Chr09g00810971 [Helianthus anomalus]
MYKMKGSDKLYSDEEFLIQNMNLNKIEKVFKLVEVKLSEIDNLSTTQRFFNFKKDKSYSSKLKNPILTIKREIITMGEMGRGTVRTIITRS